MCLKQVVYSTRYVRALCNFKNITTKAIIDVKKSVHVTEEEQKLHYIGITIYDVRNRETQHYLPQKVS